MAKTRRVQGQVYSGGAMSFFGDSVVIDLDQLTWAADGVPLLTDHDEYSVHERIGQGLPERVGGALHLAAEIVEDLPAAAPVLALLDAGQTWQASVGVRLLGYREIERGQNATVNGRDVAGPVTVFAGELVEVSAVSVGRDRDPSTRLVLAAGAAEKSKIYLNASLNPLKREEPEMTESEMKAKIEAAEKAVAELQAKLEAEQAAAKKIAEELNQQAADKAAELQAKLEAEQAAAKTAAEQAAKVAAEKDAQLAELTAGMRAPGPDPAPGAAKGADYLAAIEAGVKGGMSYEDALVAAAEKHGAAFAAFKREHIVETD